MNLRELIVELEKHHPARIVPIGFCYPHSYRGYYDQLAFEPARNVSIASMLECAKDAVGSTCNGWKGGDYEMYEDTECWLAKERECGESLGPLLLAFMLGTAEDLK